MANVAQRFQSGFASDQSSRLAPRDDSRIAADLGWHLKAPMDHKLIGNSAFFSRSEKATFAEILKLDSTSRAQCCPTIPMLPNGFELMVVVLLGTA
jgi:hypothetical protein